MIETIKAVAADLKAQGAAVSGGEKVWIADVVLGVMMADPHLDRVEILDAMVAAHRARQIRLVRIDLAPAFDRDDLRASETVIGKDASGFEDHAHLMVA